MKLIVMMEIQFISLVLLVKFSIYQRDMYVYVAHTTTF